MSDEAKRNLEAFFKDDDRLPWFDKIDPATIPDDVLRAEAERRDLFKQTRAEEARRANAARKTRGAGPGRPRKLIPGDAISMDVAYAENPPDDSGPRLTLDEWRERS